MKSTTPYGRAYPSDESIQRIAAAGDVNSLLAALQSLKQDTRARHTARMAADYADRPRYVVAGVWGHYFSDSVPEFDTRWVFDRHRWCVAVLHVKRRSDTVWSMGLPEELADLDESLVDTNEGALDLEMDDFGTHESDVLPNWVNEAIRMERQSFVEVMP